MKRAILTTFAILALAACSKKDETATTDTTAMSQTTTTTTTQTTPPPMDTTHQPAASQPTATASQPAQTAPAPPPPAPAPEPKPTTMTKHKDTVIMPSGLKYIDKKVGKGASPNKGQTIIVNYTGMLVNGKVFDSNVDPKFGHLQPFRTPIGVGKVIPGWDEGMSTMKVGGKRRLIIPADLGYGAQAMGDRIPANSMLIFDVELLGVE
jgi:peptidylprolyl isomerase